MTRGGLRGPEQTPYNHQSLARVAIDASLRVIVPTSARCIRFPLRFGTCCLARTAFPRIGSTASARERGSMGSLSWPQLIRLAVGEAQAGFNRIAIKAQELADRQS